MKLLKLLLGGLVEEVAIIFTFVGVFGVVVYFAAPERLGSWAWRIVLAACGAIVLGLLVYALRRYLRRTPPGQDPRS